MKIFIQTIESPFGTLCAAHSNSIVFCIQLPRRDNLADIEAIDSCVSKRFPTADIVHDEDALSELDRFLADFFAAPDKAGKYSGRLDTGGSPFQQRVWEELINIPVGKVVTYGEIAQKVGSPKASRAVGAACGANPIPIIIPCHRVVGSNGSLTGFGGGLDMKKEIARDGKRANSETQNLSLKSFVAVMCIIISRL